MSDAASTCGVCGAVLEPGATSDVCPVCGSSVLAGSQAPAVDEPDRGAEPEGAPDLVAGRQLVDGRFTLVRRLGRGGMGEVWLATDANLRTHGGQVALKFLTPRFRDSASSMNLLREELENSRQLNHDNIIRIHDLHTPRGEPAFILMEFVEGKTLQQTLANRNGVPFKWEELLPWVGQLCSALQYAHSKQMIHRDLKPGNLLIDERLEVKLADFGLARLAPLAGHGGGRSRVAGTQEFMSPQQMRGEPAAKTDDLYSLGATLYELLTGTCPLQRSDGFFERLEAEVPQRVSERLAALGVEGHIPPHVEDAIASCLEKEPLLRPQTVAILVRQLRLSPAEAENAGAVRSQAAQGAWRAPTGSRPRPSSEAQAPVAVEAEEEGEPEETGRSRWSNRSWTVLFVLALVGFVGVLLPQQSRELLRRIFGGPHQPPVPGHLQIELAKDWPWSKAEIRLLNLAGDTLASTNADNRSAKLCLPSSVAPGSYRLAAGRPGNSPDGRDWVNIPVTVHRGSTGVVQLAYLEPEEWRFSVEAGAWTPEVVDFWGNAMELRKLSESIGLTEWKTPPLVQGEFRATIGKQGYESRVHTNEFLPGSTRPTSILGPGTQHPQAPALVTRLSISLGGKWSWPVEVCLMSVGLDVVETRRCSGQGESADLTFAVAPGRYHVAAGHPGTTPSHADWVNTSVELLAGDTRTVQLAYVEPEQWRFNIRIPGASSMAFRKPTCVDLWGHSIEVKPQGGGSGIAWATVPLRQGRIRLTVGAERHEFCTYPIDFQPGDKMGTVPVYEPGPLIEQPTIGLGWTNTLGVEFAWVDQFWAAKTETTGREYELYASEKTPGEAPLPMLSVTSSNWAVIGFTRTNPGPGFATGTNAPVVGVSYESAAGFCEWLTEHERAANRLKTNQVYRLPTDPEWSRLAGLRADRLYTWGMARLPPNEEGNYGGPELKERACRQTYNPAWPTLPGPPYRDQYGRTAPVRSGLTNEHGLYHVGGNVAEWCHEQYRPELNPPDILADDPELTLPGGRTDLQVVRGASWYDGSQNADGSPNAMDLRLDRRRFALPSERSDRIGFRVILVENEGGSKP